MSEFDEKLTRAVKHAGCTMIVVAISVAMIGYYLCGNRSWIGMGMLGFICASVPSAGVLAISLIWQEAVPWE